MKNITPKEAWSERKPNVKNFKVFGCEAYAHVPNEIREKKFDRKSIKCIFVGYDDQRKGYRLYDPSVEDVFTSRDVKFNEGFDDMPISTPIPHVAIENHEDPNDFETGESSMEPFDMDEYI